MTLSAAGGPSGEMALKVSPSIMVRRSDVDGIFTHFPSRLRRIVRRTAGSVFGSRVGTLRFTIRSPVPAEVFIGFHRARTVVTSSSPIAASTTLRSPRSNTAVTGLPSPSVDGKRFDPVPYYRPKLRILPRIEHRPFSVFSYIPRILSAEFAIAADTPILERVEPRPSTAHQFFPVRARVEHESLPTSNRLLDRTVPRLDHISENVVDAPDPRDPLTDNTSPNIGQRKLF